MGDISNDLGHWHCELRIHTLTFLINFKICIVCSSAVNRILYKFLKIIVINKENDICIFEKNVET